MPYAGNPNLMSVGEEHVYTPEEIKEFLRCKNDPVYFCKTYIKIVHVDHGLINFVPYAYQERLIKTILENRFSIARMPRQCGKTTTLVGVLLWYIIFNENYSIAVLANKEAQSKEIMQRLKYAYEYLPKWLQQPVVTWNAQYIELANGSKVLAAATSSSAVRGKTFNFLYLDEFCVVPRNIQESFFQSVFPTITSGNTTKLCITSTPNGLDMFYKIWMDSEAGRNDYARETIHWSETPGRDDKWKESIIKATSELQFAQEYEVEFLGSSNTLIKGSTLSKLVYEEPKFETQGVKIYKEPTPDGVYAMTVDTSRSVGLDYCAFVVIDVSRIPYEVVATFKNNEISVMAYPTLIHNVATYYNECIVCVEINDNGQQVVDDLWNDLEYENILMSKTAGKGGTAIGDQLGGSGNVRRGLRTTQQVKRIGCHNLKSIIEADQILLKDFNIINELSTFISVGKANGLGYEADAGCNDDLVMCLVLFAWMAHQKYFKEVSNTDLTQRLLQDNEKAMLEKMTPFGFITNGMDTTNIEGKNHFGEESNFKQYYDNIMWEVIER